MMKPGALALAPDCVENVPGPVQTLKFARTLRSVISIGFARSAASIVILVVTPFARNLDGTIKKSETVNATARVLFISRLLPALFKHPHDRAQHYVTAPRFR